VEGKRPDVRCAKIVKASDPVTESVERRFDAAQLRWRHLRGFHRSCPCRSSTRTCVPRARVKRRVRPSASGGRHLRNSGGTLVGPSPHRPGTRAAYAGLPCPCPSSHSVQNVPTPLKQRTRAILPHAHFTGGNILAALAAGMS
jgi:hypothetical protein